jgi:hypothetical protein
MLLGDAKTSSTQSDPSSLLAILKAANDNFTYLGNPIHPKFLYEFRGWLSDGGPIIQEISVSAGTGTNQFSEIVQKDSSGASTEIDEAGNKINFRYVSLGALSDGTHVLKTYYQPQNATGVFEDLVFVRFRVCPSVDLSEPQTEQLDLRVCGSYPLGDGDDATITLGKDHVVVGVSKYRLHPITVAPRPN